MAIAIIAIIVIVVVICVVGAIFGKSKPSQSNDNKYDFSYEYEINTRIEDTTSIVSMIDSKIPKVNVSYSAIGSSFSLLEAKNSDKGAYFDNKDGFGIINEVTINKNQTSYWSNVDDYTYLVEGDSIVCVCLRMNSSYKMLVKNFFLSDDFYYIEPFTIKGNSGLYLYCYKLNNAYYIIMALYDVDRFPTGFYNQTFCGLIVIEDITQVSAVCDYFDGTSSINDSQSNLTRRSSNNTTTSSLSNDSYFNDYVFDSKSIENDLGGESYLAGKSKDEIQRMINTILARHGYIFKKQDNIDYFSQYDWYNPSYDDMDYVIGLFNNYEKANYNYLAKYRDSNY